MKNRKIIIAAIAAASVLLLLALSFNYFINSSLRKELDSSLKKAEGFFDIRYSKISGNILKRAAVVSDVAVMQDDYNQIKIRKITVSNFKAGNGMPLSLDVVLNDVDIINNGKSLKKSFSEALGYDREIIFDISASYAYDKKSSQLKVEKIELFSSDAARITLSTSFSNADPGKGLEENVFSETQPLLFTGGEISFTDFSLIEKTLLVLSENAGIPIDDFRGLVKIQAGYLADVFQADLNPESIARIRSFIDKPDQLVMYFNLQAPVPVKDFVANYNKPVRLLKMLNPEFR